MYIKQYARIAHCNLINSLIQFDGKNENRTASYTCITSLHVMFSLQTRESFESQKEYTESLMFKMLDNRVST